MRFLFKIALLVSVLLLGFTAKSQDLTAIAKLDTNVILIGDQINLELIVIIQNEQFPTFPVFSDTLVEGVEILNISQIDTFINKEMDSLVFKQNLTITSFDSGFYVIPPIRFILDNDTGNYMETEPILLEVQTIPVNPAEDIKDIKGPLSIPLSWKQIALYVGIGLFVVILIGVILFFVLTKKKPSDLTSFVQRKPLTAHEIALTKLQTLKERKLWQAGMVKEYHSDISEILREYLEKRYGFNALEQVSDEILLAMKDRVNEELLRKLRKILELSDLAKFAKFQPLPDENEQSLNFAFELVNATKPAALPQEEKPNEERKE